MTMLKAVYSVPNSSWAVQYGENFISIGDSGTFFYSRGALCSALDRCSLTMDNDGTIWSGARENTECRMCQTTILKGERIYMYDADHGDCAPCATKYRWGVK